MSEPEREDSPLRRFLEGQEGQAIEGERLKEMLEVLNDVLYPYTWGDYVADIVLCEALRI